MLGLSWQVPAQPCYLTNGPSRRVRIGCRVINLRHASPRNLVAAGSAAGTVFQAVRDLGQGPATVSADTLASHLSPADRKRLARATSKAPAWMRPILDQITGVAG